MQKFIFKSTFFLISILILVQALAYVSENLAPDENARILVGDQQIVEGLLNSSDRVETIVLGNSHAHAIGFELLGHNGYRLSRTGRDLFEIQYYLEGLLPKLPKVNTVFIAVSYFSFERDNGVSDEVRVRRMQTYAVVPSWRVMKGDFSNFVVGKLHPIFPIMSVARDDSWEGISEVVFHPAQTETNNKEATNGCKDRGAEYLTAHAKLRVPSNIEHSIEMAAKHPNLRLDTYETVVEIIQVLQKRNIRIIFFTPPYFKAYTQDYQLQAPETIAIMKQNMQLLQQEYGVEYYDFSMDEDFILDHRAFVDSDHLNPCSARQVAAKFKQMITEREYLGNISK